MGSFFFPFVDKVEESGAMEVCFLMGNNNRRQGVQMMRAAFER